MLVGSRRAAAGAAQRQMEERRRAAVCCVSRLPPAFAAPAEAAHPPHRGTVSLASTVLLQKEKKEPSLPRAVPRGHAG